MRAEVFLEQRDRVGEVPRSVDELVPEAELPARDRDPRGHERVALFHVAGRPFRVARPGRARQARSVAATPRQDWLAEIRRRKEEDRLTRRADHLRDAPGEGAR